jgi:hypothetical protein
MFLYQRISAPKQHVCSEQTALADHVCTRRDPT